MSAPHLRHHETDRHAATHIEAAVSTPAIVCACVKAVFWREFVLRRALAQISEQGTVYRGYEWAPTEGGPDKRPQCAARLGCCFDWIFYGLRQCALSGRKVHVRFKSLSFLRFVNIAGGGDGA